MSIIYNPNDVSITQMNSDSSSFVEQVLVSSPNSLIMFDSNSHLTSVSSQSFLSNSSSYTVSASWAPFVDNPNAVSASWASNSISASYSLSSSYAPTSTTITASWSTNAISSSYSNTSSYFSGAGAQFVGSGSFQLWNPTTSTWYVLSISGSVGEETIQWIQA